jgi:hypothetical protein
LDAALDEISSAANDETGSKASGFQRQLNSFDTVFALEVALQIFVLTDDCSKATQKVAASAVASQHAMRKSAEMLRQLRTEERFEGLYQTAVDKAEKRGIEPPAMRRLIRCPARYDEGSAPVQLDVKTHYRQQYYAVLDTAVNAIEHRVEQPGLDLYIAIEQLILNSANGNGTNSTNDTIAQQLDKVCNFFRDDVDRERLQTQLSMLPELCQRQPVDNIAEFKSHFIDLGAAAYMFSEIETLMTLFYVSHTR